MNKKLTTKITLKALLLIGALCSSAESVLFAPPKKKTSEVNKNIKKDDFFEMINKFDKKYESKNQEDLKMKKEQDLKEKKELELKKLTHENTWSLKDYFNKKPISFYGYYKMLCDLKESFEYQYDVINVIERYYHYCVKKYNSQQEIIETWGNKISFDEHDRVSFDTSKTLDLNNIENIHLHLIARQLFEHGTSFSDRRYFKKIKLLFQLYTSCESFDEKTQQLAKDIFKLASYSRYLDLQKAWCKKKDSNFKNITNDITQFSFKARSKFFKFISNIIDLCNEDYDSLTKFGKDITLETDEKLQQLIKNARDSKKELSVDLNKEIKRCESIIEKLEQAKQTPEKKNTETSNIFEKKKKEELSKKESDSDEFDTKESIELENKKELFIEEQEPPYKEEHPRVSEWFTNSEKRLYEDYSNYSETIKKLMIKFHAFTKKVDLFITPLATKCSWLKNNKDIESWSYNIPAEIIDKDTDKHYIGVISYGVDKDGMIFHRCFSEKIYSKIEENIRKKHEDSLYPSIQEVKNLKKLEYVGFQSTKDVTVKQNPLVVEITDKPNNMVIKLCIPMQGI